MSHREFGIFRESNANRKSLQGIDHPNLAQRWINCGVIGPATSDRSTDSTAGSVAHSVAHRSLSRNRSCTHWTDSRLRRQRHIYGIHDSGAGFLITCAYLELETLCIYMRVCVCCVCDCEDNKQM